MRKRPAIPAQMEGGIREEDCGAEMTSVARSLIRQCEPALNSISELPSDVHAGGELHPHRLSRGPLTRDAPAIFLTDHLAEILLVIAKRALAGLLSVYSCHVYRCA